MRLQQQMWKYTQLNYEGLAIYNSYLHVVIKCKKKITQRIYVINLYYLLIKIDF